MNNVDNMHKNFSPLSQTLETKTSFGELTDFSSIKSVWLHLRKTAGSLFNVVCVLLSIWDNGERPCEYF